MFKLEEKCEIKRNTLKCDFLWYSPSEISTINTASSQIYVNVPKEDSIISLLNSYLDLYFDVLHAATNVRYANNNIISLVILGPIAFCSKCMLTTSSGKHLEDISHAHIVPLVYKLITGARGSDNLSIGFDRDRGIRQRELTNNEPQKGKFHLIIMLKGIFGFSQCQEKGTFGLGYKLTLTGKTGNAVLNKDNAINNGKKINAIEKHVPHYTPSISNQAILSEQ